MESRWGLLCVTVLGFLMHVQGQRDFDLADALDDPGSIQCLDIFTFCKAVHGSFCEPGDKSSMLIRFLVSLCAQNPPRSQAQISTQSQNPRTAPSPGCRTTVEVRILSLWVPFQPGFMKPTLSLLGGRGLSSGCF
ncbi:uncharacterized protein LOC109489879 isoform X1 [Ailuropoda melanoleuca]|uniref:uncharacterized protein LOC109489879 isoform X1 n=1 Tax=Ailuropoda melanoleuca TaxID=9646 RepID=UPI001494B386|nr:uncharacterized protein LOC109489879 isoform X1 [Ailuropoda melanoleuca]